MPAPPVFPVTSHSDTVPMTREIPGPPELPFNVQRVTDTFSNVERMPPPPQPETAQPLTCEFSPTSIPCAPLPCTLQSRTRAFAPSTMPSRPFPCTEQDSTVTFARPLLAMPSRKADDTRQPETSAPVPT